MTKIAAIFISPEKGRPMQACQSVDAIAGKGLETDRYASDKGSYSFLMNKRFRIENVNAPFPLRHVSLISLNALNEANKKLARPFQPIETRRNLLVENISAEDLLVLIDREFAVGEVRMRGVEDCSPCALPGNMVNKPGFKEAFARCGGLRAEILTSGTIQIGSALRIS